MNKKPLICSILLAGTLVGANNSYSYTINLSPVDLNVTVNPLGGSLGPVASGHDYVELVGANNYYPYYPDNNYWFRAGTSVTSGTSKVSSSGDIYSNAYIEFNRWNYSMSGGPVETWHRFKGLYLLNIASDGNHAGPICLNSVFDGWYGGAGGDTCVYDELYNLIARADFMNISGCIITPGKNYFLKMDWWEDYVWGDESSTMTFSLVESDPVPEPTTIFLVSCGLLFMMARKYKFFAKR